MGLWRASLKQWNYLVNTLGFSLPKKKVWLKEPQERYLVKFTLDFRKFFHSKSVFTYILMSLKPIQIYLLFPRNRSDMSCEFCLVFLIMYNQFINLETSLTCVGMVAFDDGTQEKDHMGC